MFTLPGSLQQRSLVSVESTLDAADGTIPAKAAALEPIVKRKLLINPSRPSDPSSRAPNPISSCVKSWLFATVDGKAVHCEDTLLRAMEARGFERIYKEPFPLTIREHARKYQYIVADGSAWRKI